MGRDFEEFVAKRCECALMKDVAYVDKEHCENIDNIELQSIAEKLCYKQGFIDAMEILKCSHEM